MFTQSFRLFKTALANEPTNKRNLLYVVLLEIVYVGLLYFLNRFYGSLYDGISNHNPRKIYTSMASFAGLAAILVFVGGLTTFYLNKLAFSIREGLNTHFTSKIDRLAHIENIEQRVQEDLKNFGERSVEFWAVIFRSALKLPIFLGVVVSLTKWWVGLLLVLSVVLGTLATKVLARRLIALQAIQESNEANYRKGVRNRVFEVFLHIKDKFQEINLQVKKLSFLQSGLGQTFVLLPFVILIPLYLSKKITMGILMQTANAMGRVIDSLTVLIEQRQLIVNISTCLMRMETLEAEQPPGEPNPEMELVTNPMNGQMSWQKKAS